MSAILSESVHLSCENATEDKMIPPPAQRAMAGRVKAEVTEVPGSHSVYVSKPAAVAEIIEKAATSSN
jgi:hypothetical protein